MTMTNRQAWTALSVAAIGYAGNPHDSRAMEELKKAARDWVAAPRPAQAQGDGAVFPPYGRSKGLPVRGASPADLEFYANGCRRTLADAGKARWHDKEAALLAAIEAEQRRQRDAGMPDDCRDHTDALAWTNSDEQPF